MTSIEFHIRNACINHGIDYDTFTAAVLAEDTNTAPVALRAELLCEAHAAEMLAKRVTELTTK